MMEHSPPFPSPLWGCLGQLGGVACLMILKALFSHDYTESVMGESFSRPSISDYSPGHRGYDRMSPSRCWLSEARRRVWPSKARSCRVCASELDSWWDAFALGFILQQQANRLMPLRRWPLWAGTFSHRRWKGSTGPVCYSFDSDWQHGLVPVPRKCVHRLLHCYPLINFWQTLQYKTLTGNCSVMQAAASRNFANGS